MSRDLFLEDTAIVHSLLSFTTGTHSNQCKILWLTSFFVARNVYWKTVLTPLLKETMFC